MIGAVFGMSVSAAAVAQSTAIRFEASTDGGATWASAVEASPGSTVQVRMNAVLSGATALGLAGFTCQPRVSNWSVGFDQLMPFTFPGIQNDGTPSAETQYDGRAVRSAPATNTGRIFPFGAAGQGAAAASGVLIGHQQPGQVWFAGSHATSLGSQPEWGLSIAQLTPELGGTNFNTSMNAEVFRFSMVIGNVESIRSVNLGNLADDHVFWYMNSSGSGVLIVSNLSVSPATITSVPGPGVLGVVGVGLLTMARRRR